MRGDMAMGISSSPSRVMGSTSDATGSARPVMGSHPRVMAGLVLATHDFRSTTFRKTWVAGTSPAMTRGRQGLLS
jgi:hypothetical protein